MGEALVLVPHPDDESIGCGGLLRQLYEQTIPTTVVLVSDGSGGGTLPEGTDHKREKEFRRAMALLHPDAKLVFWRLPDGQLENSPELLPRLERLLAHCTAKTVVCPWREDLHPDHAAIAWGLEQSLAFTSVEQVLYYEIWTPLVANRILEVSEHWSTKKQALSCHVTALECGDYVRAMEGLATYRSLFTQSMARAGHYAEAYRSEAVQSQRYVQPLWHRLLCRLSRYGAKQN
ncbi:PIG-L deacetylase family protein [Thiomicrospira sp. WB1]|uniref:PIG-L deacetylase family protein n=1 Tax=Thiomicrospira sp. WB1 TaxID=1685380 RepID=UPI000838C2F0|nr:PIG-L family deacetylase [Thiomicrospira sp. WB1]